MKKKVYLIGFMASGKSTISRLLSEAWECRRIEMDQWIEQQEGMPISEIFSKYGEAYFRERETELLRRIRDIGDRSVVSCGGGLPLREENRQILREDGTVVYLLVRPETVLSRLNVRQTQRPVLKGHMTLPEVSALLQKRDPLYRAAADFAIETDGRTAAEICSEIRTHF